MRVIGLLFNLLLAFRLCVFLAGTPAEDLAQSLSLQRMITSGSLLEGPFIAA